MLLKDITLGAKINFVVSGITTMELMGIINVGAVTLSVEGREFVLDSYYTDFNDVAGDKPMVEVRCRLEVDEETFEDGYTLTCGDLLSSNLKATFYCGFENDEDDEEEIVYEATNMVTTLYFGTKTLEIPTINED